MRTTIGEYDMIAIRRYEHINYTPAVVLAMRGWLELNDKGIGEQAASVHWEQHGIVAFADSKAVGVITWTEQKPLAAAYAEQVYVIPEWRRKGIFKLMWDELEEWAAEKEFYTIRLGTHPMNTLARSIYDRMGRLHGLFYEFDVDGKGSSGKEEKG
jgi:GNAT superfamily N-acetyltransferase